MKENLAALDTNMAIDYSRGVKIVKDQVAIGTSIPENDIWIAAFCSADDIPLFTSDVHFQKNRGNIF